MQKKPLLKYSIHNLTEYLLKFHNISLPIRHFADENTSPAMDGDGEKGEQD